MLHKKSVPQNLLLPHFLKLILQNEVDTEAAKAEAEELSKEDEIPDDFEPPLEKEEFQDFSNFSAITLRTEAEEPFKVPTKLDVALPGQFYLDKEATTRRAAENEPIKAVTDALHRRWSRTVWRQELDNMEPVYRLPALILRRFRYIRDVEPTRIGPGTYDIDYEELQKRKRNQTTRGIMLNCSERFPKEKVEADPMPGPGSYGDPYETYERALGKCKHSGKVPLFQSGPCNVRTVMAVKNSNPGPGQYQFKCGIDEMLDKRTSAKGPYNLYSSKRDVIPYGYFKTRPVNPLGPGQYNIRTTLKLELSNCCNNFKGRLAPSERFRSVTGERMTLVSPLWPIAETRPGPAHYTPEQIFPAKKNYKFGFNASSPARPLQKPYYDMAPDKYRPEIWDKRKSAIGHGWESDFISKTGRLDLLKIQVYSERVRAKDIPHHQRVGFDETKRLVDVNCCVGVDQRSVKDVSKIYCKDFKKV